MCTQVLFHELGRSLPPYMRGAAGQTVDWESYAALRKKHAQAIAWRDPAAPAEAAAGQVRTRSSP